MCSTPVGDSDFFSLQPIANHCDKLNTVHGYKFNFVFALKMPAPRHLKRRAMRAVRFHASRRVDKANKSFSLVVCRGSP